MVWIYLAESEDLPKPWKATSGLSPIVKTIDIAKVYSYREWRMETSPTGRCGTTYGLSTDGLTVAWTSFMADSPARTFPAPDAEKAWGGAEADFFSRSSGSLAKYDLASSSWRTFQRLLFEEQNELLASFAASGMTVDGAFYPLRMWERITDAKDGGYLPTPRETDGSGGAAALRVQGALGLNDKRFQLREWVKAWPTPTSKDGDHPRGPNSKQQCLARSARMWPTPKAQNANGPGIHGSGGLDLQTSVMFATPQATDYKRDGRPHGFDQQDLPRQVGGQLNPTWVEWLMGYRSEWTVLEDWATLWFRPRREKPSRD